MTGYWVREAGPGDLTRVRNLARRIARELRLSPGRAVERWGGADYGLLWVVEEGRGRIVGSCAIREELDGVWRLHALFLDSGLRRRGLGRSLVEHAVAQIRLRGGLKVVFCAPAESEDARVLLEHLGFCRSETASGCGDTVWTLTLGMAS